MNLLPFRIPVCALALPAIYAVTMVLPAAKAADEGLAWTMDYIVKELAVLLDRPGDEGEATARELRIRREHALHELQDQASLMAAHIGGDDRALMASNLVYKLQALRWQFVRGDMEAYRRGLDEVIDACGACHRRTARAGSSRFASEILPDDLLAGIDVPSKVKILIASRQFERARDALDTAIPNAATWAELEPLLRLRIDVAMRLLPDHATLEASLHEVAAKLAPTSAGKAIVARWLDGLTVVKAFDFESGPMVSVNAVEQLLEAAQTGDSERAYPIKLAASRMSYALLSQTNLPTHGLGKAYYLAALAEANLPTIRYLPLRELFLELSIRTAPEEPSAKQALEQLRSSLESQFPGDTMPGEVRTHLKGLENIVQ